MKIDLNVKMKDLSGVPMDDGQTLKDVAVTALITPLEGDNTLAPQKKFELGLLAQKIATSDDGVEITSDEITTLKDRIGKGYAPLVVLNAWQHLESAKTA